MIDRRNILILAGFTLVCFATAGIVGNHHPGLRGVVGDISWFGFLLGLLLLIVIGGARLVRRLSRSGASRSHG